MESQLRACSHDAPAFQVVKESIFSCTFYRGVAKGGARGGRPPPNCLQNSKRFKSGEILREGDVRQAAVHSYIIISIIICVCASCYCKNQILARQINPKTCVRRQEIAFPRSRNRKFSRGSMSPDPLGGSCVRHSMFAPPPQTFTSGYARDFLLHHLLVSTALPILIILDLICSYFRNQNIYSEMSCAAVVPKSQQFTACFN